MLRGGEGGGGGGGAAGGRLGRAAAPVAEVPGGQGESGVPHGGEQGGEQGQAGIQAGVLGTGGGGHWRGGDRGVGAACEAQPRAGGLDGGPGQAGDGAAVDRWIDGMIGWINNGNGEWVVIWEEQEGVALLYFITTCRV